MVAVLVVWTLVLLTLLTMPLPEYPLPHFRIFLYWDRIVHVILFAVTGIVSVFGIRFRRFGSRVCFGLFFSLFLAFGVAFLDSLFTVLSTIAVFITLSMSSS